jgi:hypothetical protein
VNDCARRSRADKIHGGGRPTSRVESRAAAPRQLFVVPVLKVYAPPALRQTAARALKKVSPNFPGEASCDAQSPNEVSA